MFFAFFLQFAILLLFFGMAGAILIKVTVRHWLPEIDFVTVFASVLVGAIASAVVTAAFFTHGKTILTAFIPIGVALIYFCRPKDHTIHKHTDKSPGLTVILITMAVGILVFSICYWMIHKSGKFPFLIPHVDYLLYSNSSYFFHITGQENIFHINNIYDPGYHGPKPHHYVDSWLNVLSASLFDRLYIVNLYLFVLPLLYTITLLGVMALCETNGIAFGYSLIIGLIFLFLGGVVLGMDHLFKVFSNASNLAFSALHGPPKLVLYYPFILSSLLLLYHNRKLQAILVLLCLPITSITALPAVAGGIFCLLLVNTQAKLISSSDASRAFMATVLTLLFIALFYFLLDRGTVGMEGTQVNGLGFLIQDFFNIGNLKTGVNIIGGTCVQLFVLYSPFLILLFLFRNEVIATTLQSRALLSFAAVVACVFLSGLGAWALFQQLLNAMQLFNNPAIPFLNTLCLCLIVELVRLITAKSVSPLRATMGMAILFFTVGIHVFQLANERQANARRDRFGTDYLQAIKTFADSTSHLGSVAGVSIEGTKDYQSVFSKYTVYYVLGDYLPFFRNGLVPVSISDYEITSEKGTYVDSLRDSNAVKLGFFYRFVQEQKKNSTFNSVQQSQVDFITKYNVRYAIVSANGNVSPLLHRLVKHELSDPISRERFLIFR